MSGISTEHVLVVLELGDGILTRASMETLACAQALAPGRLSAVLLKDPSSNPPESITNVRLDTLYLLHHPALKTYSAEIWVTALMQAVRAIAPSLILMPHSYQGRDYAPALAAKLERALISDCIGIEQATSGMAFIRQVFQGRAQMRVSLHGEAPGLVTVQPGAFRIESLQGGNIPPEMHDLPVEMQTAQQHITAEPPCKAGERNVDLSRAEIIVAVGRGIKGPEHIDLARRFAQLLGAELAASRPVCDEGWLPMDHQVGSSGQTVTPKLYFAIGISGAVQHSVGMKGSNTIVAINKDPNAPIFKIADYGIVGDLFEVLPALIAALEARHAA